MLFLFEVNVSVTPLTPTQDIFYEIDGKTQSCTKNKLHISWHPLDIPNDAKFYTAMTMGSSSVEDERLKINVWGGDLPNTKGGLDAKKTRFHTTLSIQ